MNNVDVSKIKVGDVVGVRVLATNASGRSVNVRANGEFEHAWIPDHAIASHTPAPRPALKVGDRVRTPNTASPDREIIWFEGGHVYFRPLGVGHTVTQAPLSEVEQWERV